MFLLQLKLLTHEGYLIKTAVSFVLFSFLYAFEPYLIIPATLLLISKDILSQSFPNEAIYINYKITHADLDKIQRQTNVLIILLINGFNMGFLLLALHFPIEYGLLGTLSLKDLLNQILAFNTILLFILLLSNQFAKYCYAIEIPHLLTGLLSLFVFGVMVILGSGVSFFLLKGNLPYGLIGFSASFFLWYIGPLVTKT